MDQDWKSGDTVHISLCGPATGEELEETKRIHEEAYPGVDFEFTWNEEPIEVTGVEHGNSVNG